MWSIVTDYLSNHSSLILFIIGSILVPGIYVWWQTSQGKKIAIDGGVYDKPIIDINAIYRHFKKNGSMGIIVGLNVNDLDKITSLLNIPIYINNCGSKSLEDVSLRLTFEENSVLSIKNNINENMKIFSNEYGFNKLYKFGSIHPKTAIKHHELLKINTNILNKKQRFNLSVSAKNQEPIEVEVNMYIIKSTSTEQLIEQSFHFMKKDYVVAFPKRNIKKNRNKKYKEFIIDKVMEYMPGGLPKGWTFVPDKNDSNADNI